MTHVYSSELVSRQGIFANLVLKQAKLGSHANPLELGREEEDENFVREIIRRHDGIFHSKSSISLSDKAQASHIGLDSNGKPIIAAGRSRISTLIESIMHRGGNDVSGGRVAEKKGNNWNRVIGTVIKKRERSQATVTDN